MYSVPVFNHRPLQSNPDDNYLKFNIYVALRSCSEKKYKNVMYQQLLWSTVEKMKT